MIAALRPGFVRTAALTVLGGLCAATSLEAQDRPELHAFRVTTPPRIDGVLDDAAWSGEPLVLGPWISYNPLRGETSVEETKVRIAYDDRFIYFAFHCLSDDPEQIRTTVSRRDNVFNDDWVGISLDSTGSGQSSYHLMVNPSGIQMDAVNTTAAGEKFESDFVWESAGRRTSDGYTVEMAVPLQTIRFSGNHDVTMGILFWRHVSRSGVSYSWPEMPPGQWVFDRHAHVIFPDLAPRRLLELLPSATLPRSQTRVAPDRWTGVTGGPSFGVSGKYGLTSEITVDATANPDFSQVESDAFQVEVNQRFPVFYAEKRPFFMEGLGLFNVAGTGNDSNMRVAVHTRKIVNPGWGAKLTGTAGRFSFGALEASDDVLPDVVDENTTRDSTKLFSIGRATYAFGGSNYLGALVTDTLQGDLENRVVGGDMTWKPTPSQRVTSTYLYSQTRVGAEATDGAAGHVEYTYDTRRFFATTFVEDYGAAFQMDTAFYNHTGFTSAVLFSEVNFYPESAKRMGLIRVHPFVFLRGGHDRLQGGNDNFALTGVAFNFSRQGFLRIQSGYGHEPWLGQSFRTGTPIGGFGNVQLFRWLYIGGSFFPAGWSTFYDPINPYQGRSTSGSFEVTWQPNQHFNQNVSYNGVRFERADTGEHVFDVTVINSKTIYQFDKHFLLRLIEQYDSSRHQLLTDVLAAYELVPGTVFHAGYGSLYEERSYESGQLILGPGKYLTTSRGVFFKASYLYRF